MQNIPCSWIGRFNIVKISVLPNLTYRFNTIPIKITESYVVDVAKPILKFIRKAKARIAKTVLKKKKVRGLMQPDLRLTEQYC